MFGEQNATEMGAVLLDLDQEHRLKKIPTEEYETRKVFFFVIQSWFKWFEVI